MDPITADPAFIVGPVTTSAPSINAGQSITLVSHASGVTPTVAYRWYSDGPCSLAISGATSPTYVTSTSVTTTYAYVVTDSAYSPVSQCFFFQAEDGIRAKLVTGVQTCALPI